MPDWTTNMVELKKRNTLSDKDHIEMIHRYGTWAANLAISQANPDSDTRKQILDRAQRLRKKIDTSFK